MFGHFNRDDKATMGFAIAEARELGHREVGNDHLILGMLGNARTPLFAVLTELGLTLADAREASRAHHGEHDADAAEAAEQSAADRYEEDREALRSIGIDLDKVREAVRDRFGDDLADGWADRMRRGRGRGRGRGHGGPHGRRGGCGPDFGAGADFGPGFARGPQGFGPAGFGPEGLGPEGFGREGFEGPFAGGRGRRGPRGRGMRPRFAVESRQALEAAVRIARERGDSRLRIEYLLLGIIEAGDAASIAVIESATTADDLKAAVLASLPEAPAGV
ncbi:Clp protease N-terminal domain-containing protein [Gordonia sp. NPDC003376]